MNSLCNAYTNRTLDSLNNVDRLRGKGWEPVGYVHTVSSSHHGVRTQPMWRSGTSRNALPPQVAGFFQFFHSPRKAIQAGGPMGNSFAIS